MSDKRNLSSLKGSRSNSARVLDKNKNKNEKDHGKYKKDNAKSLKIPDGLKRILGFIVSIMSFIAMILLIGVLFFVGAVPAVASEKYYSLSLQDSDGKMIYSGINVLSAEPRDFTSTGTRIKASLLSYNSSVLFERSFDLVPNSTNLIDLPYLKAVTTIAIKDTSIGDSLNINVAAFSDLCGDGICESKENFGTCPSDCASGSQDGFCDMIPDGICDPDCTSGKDVDCGDVVSPVDHATTTLPASVTLAPTTTRPSSTSPSSTLASQAQGISALGSKTFMIMFIVLGLIFLVMIILFAASHLGHADPNLTDFIRDNMQRGYQAAQIKEHLISQGYSAKDVDKAADEAMK